MKKLFCIIILCTSFFLSGCSSLYTYKVDDPQIRSILFVPVINDSTEVVAADILPSSALLYLDERGYYMFPPLTVKTVLEAEGLYDAEKVQEQDPAALAELFDADAVVFAHIKVWSSMYALFTTVSTGAVTYTVYDRNGVELLNAGYFGTYSPSSNSNSIIDVVVNMVVAGIERADPSYDQVSAIINNQFVSKNFQNGPYSKQQ